MQACDSNMSEAGKIDIYGLKIDNISYVDLENIITDAFLQNKKLLITYANANTINSIYKNKRLKDKLNSFDAIHPDGVGIYVASKFLFGSKGIREIMNGSDFYPILTELAIKNRCKIFFFGHTNAILNLIKSNHPELNISGTQNGYDFKNTDVITLINYSCPDIIIIGLSFPKQEEWVLNNIDNLNCKICICVGDGIKVFSGTKFRGPRILRTLGFEWFFRFLNNPLKYFSRYLIGNPLFLYRIIRLKFRKFKE